MLMELAVVATWLMMAMAHAEKGMVFFTILFLSMAVYKGVLL